MKATSPGGTAMGHDGRLRRPRVKPSGAPGAAQRMFLILLLQAAFLLLILFRTQPPHEGRPVSRHEERRYVVICKRASAVELTRNAFDATWIDGP